jgi:hypothetical protein
VFSELKITANSTYWEAKVVFDRPYLTIREQNTAIGEGFWDRREASGKFSLSHPAPEHLLSEKLVIKPGSNNGKDTCVG